MKGRPCQHFLDHICKAVIMNHPQIVCLDNVKVDFETGSLGVKKLVTRPNQRKNLVNTLEVTFLKQSSLTHAQIVCLDVLEVDSETRSLRVRN